MSRVSSIVFGSFVAILATTAGCKVTAETKTRFTETNVVRSDTIAWTGEKIVINIVGTGVSQNGGITVKTDPATTMVNTNARILALAFSDHKADADLSLADVKTGYVITHTGSGPTGQIDVTCPHGGTHGDSDSGSSGCELINVVIPAGSAAMPLDVKTLGGNGAIKLDLGNSYATGIAANSQNGDVTADLPATPGGTIQIVTALGDINATLPTGFATDTLEIAVPAASFHAGPFSDITAASTSRGTAGTGLKLVHFGLEGLGELTLAGK